MSNYKKGIFSDIKLDATLAARETLSPRDAVIISAVEEGLDENIKTRRILDGKRAASTGIGPQGYTELLGKLGMFLALGKDGMSRLDDNLLFAEKQ